MKKEKQDNLDILKFYQQLQLSLIASAPYDRDAQMRNLRRFSLYQDNTRYYASGDTRTDRLQGDCNAQLERYPEANNGG